MRTRKGTNEGFLSDADVRSRVVLEILNTEKDYVKNLEDVVEVNVIALLNHVQATPKNVKDLLVLL